MSFKLNVLKIIGEIQEGEVMSYSEVAKRAGSPKAFRSVGIIISFAYKSGVVLPYHRVIRKNREVGWYIGGTHSQDGARKKGDILVREGHTLSGHTVNGKYVFDKFVVH